MNVGVRPGPESFWLRRLPAFGQLVILFEPSKLNPTMQGKEDAKVDWLKERTALDLDGHNAYVHDFLTDFFGQCVNGDGAYNRVFVPLCGKSASDIKWLYDEGFRIYGVDASEKALQKVFNLLGVSYSYTPAICEGFGLFKSHDERVKLFCGDIFRFNQNVAGRLFEVIWDRGALMTVSGENRERYIDTMRNLLLPTGRVLLAVFAFDASKWKGPPYPIRGEDVHRYFGRNFHVNSLKSQNGLRQWHQEHWGIEWLKETCYMLSLKT